MTAAGATFPGADLKEPWSRLLVACSLSVALHIALLAGVPVNPTGGMPNIVSTIQARLETTAPESGTHSEAAELQKAAASAELTPAPVRDDVQPKRAEQPKAQSQSADGPAASPSKGLDIPLIRDPTYYTPRELDAYPAALAPIQPACPEPAMARHANGQVRLLLLIDEFGLVNEASVLDAQPSGLFEEATLAAFREARFSPAQRQGHAVKSRQTLLVKFICDSGEVGAR